MKLTISAKFLIVCMSVFAVLLLFIGYSISTSSLIKEFRDDIVNYSNIQNEITISKNIQLNITNIWQFITDASLTKNHAVIEEEARVSLEGALSDIGKLTRLNADDPDHFIKLEAIRDDLLSMWAKGEVMFSAYERDWDEGNIEMEEYDIMNESIIADVNEIIKDEEFNERAALDEMKEMVVSSLRIARVMPVVMIAISGAIIFMLIMLRRSIVGPLHELAIGARRVASGDLTTRLEDKGRTDEIGGLTRDFIIMLESLKKVFILKV